MRFKQSSYNGEVYSPNIYGHLVDHVASVLVSGRKELKFDAIAFRGMSGAAIAYPVSYLTRIPLICTRKSAENSHGYDVEGPAIEVHKYIILDDFISTGNTIAQIVRSISVQKSYSFGVDSQTPPKCVGIYLYLKPDRDYSRKYKVEDYEVPIFGIMPAEGFIPATT